MFFSRSGKRKSYSSYWKKRNQREMHSSIAPIRTALPISISMSYASTKRLTNWLLRNSLDYVPRLTLKHFAKRI